MEEREPQCPFRCSGFSSCYGKLLAPDSWHSDDQEFCGGNYSCCAFYGFGPSEKDRMERPETAPGTGHS